MKNRALRNRSENHIISALLILFVPYEKCNWNKAVAGGMEDCIEDVFYCGYVLNVIELQATT